MSTLLKAILSILIFVFIKPAISQQDTIRPISFGGVPAISSSPETGVQFGVAGQLAFDLYQNNISSRRSQLTFAVLYSTKNQLNILNIFRLFGKDESYYIDGKMEYQNWVDRHYGFGNDASNTIIEYNFTEQTVDTLNFLNYGINNFRSRISFNKKLKEGLFAGIVTNIYSGSDFESLADSASYSTDEINPTILEGQYLGLGLNLLYDTRDNLNSPSSGQYIQLTYINNRDWLFGDYNFSTLEFQARAYLKTFKQHIFAIRIKTANTLSGELLPFAGLKQLGGEDLLRGYFRGTYLDKHYFTFTTEYRFPLFSANNSSLWKIWKHLDLALFFSGGQAFGDSTNFSFSEFRFSAGGGFRILLNKSQRLKLRVDYGLGLAKNSAGVGKKQSGLYLTLNEAF